MRLIAPFGFYGWGNIGDESTLQGFARLVADSESGATAWVGARNPEHCRKAEPAFRYFSASARRSIRRRWAWKTADAMVVPGGTPIVDAMGLWPLNELLPLVARAVSEGKPVAFIGTGTEELRRGESRRLVAERLAPTVRAWTVRSERDRARLVEYGVPPDRVTEAADLAWGLDPVTQEFGRSYLATLGVDLDTPLVGVNVNIEQFVRERHPVLLVNLAAFLDAVIETHDARILFLCNEVREGATFDLAASRELIGSMRHPERATIVPNEYWLPQAMMSLIACCRFTVSTRYHFCLFSALQAVPFLAVQRSQKVEDLCADLGWTCGVALDELTPARLVGLFADLSRRRPALVIELLDAAPRMRARAGRNAIALAALGAGAHRSGKDS